MGVALAGLAVAGLKEIDHGLGAGTISLITWVAIAGGLGLFVSGWDGGIPTVMPSNMMQSKRMPPP